MAKSNADRQKDYRKRNAPVTKRNAKLLRNAQAQMPHVVDVIDTGDERLTVMGRRPDNSDTVTDLECAARDGAQPVPMSDCPDDWLNRINSMPAGAVRPLFGVTGELRNKTHRQLQSAMPTQGWQSSQEYAEVVYRLLYWTDEQLKGAFIPSWRAAA